MIEINSITKIKPKRLAEGIPRLLATAKQLRLSKVSAAIAEEQLVCGMLSISKYPASCPFSPGAPRTVHDTIKSYFFTFLFNAEIVFIH